MLQNEAITALRILSMDAINRANSGHPGICLGAAPLLEVLYSDFMNVYVPEEKWINRDRFVLSAGHGAPLLYSLLHFAGFDITLNDLKNLRQFNSKTPGHPEINHTKGIDASTGPLGQGVGMAVGMAIAEKYLSRKFNRENLELIDHFTYVLVGDGDLQEGVTQEALSLAGHLGLHKFIILYDSNQIQLDGSTALTISENTKKKYEAMNFNYILVEDGNDVNQIKCALRKAKKSEQNPTLMEFKTKIGYASPLEGKSDVHGSPLGDAKTQELRKNLNWNLEPFHIPDTVYAYFKSRIILRGKKNYEKWKKIEKSYQQKFSDDYAALKRAISENYETKLEKFFSDDFFDATRNVCGNILSTLSEEFRTLIGGSADLSKSTKVKGIEGDFNRENNGRNINFGVREHAMGAITNGINLHGGIRSFCAGFFVFSDYLKPSIRLASLMEVPSIFIFSHDSIAVGEDGPTHQPIEQLAGLRSIPNLNVIRPAGARETLGALKIALKSTKTPTVIVTSRQNIKTNHTREEGVEKGAYIVLLEKNHLDGIFLATGSEVELALQASLFLERKNIYIRVVSMPSAFLFDAQPLSYRREILPENIKVLSIEMASTLGWHKYADQCLGIDRFGMSGAMEKMIDEYGFTILNIATLMEEMLGK